MKFILLYIGLFIGLTAFSQETNTSIGFSLSPNYSSVRYPNANVFSDIDIEVIQSGTKGELGLSGNFFFQYELMDKLFVTWGVGVQNYRYARELFSEDEVMSLKSVYSQHYLQLNTSIKYRIVNSLYVRAGMGVDLLAEARYKLLNSASDDIQEGKDGANFKEAMLPISFGVGYELKLSERVNLMAEVFGTLVVTDAIVISPNLAELQRKPWQLGASIGVIRSF
ncbi:MAG: outer membrane beta-barrel protein [Crocinitomicaceae bacterium]